MACSLPGDLFTTGRVDDFCGKGLEGIEHCTGLLSKSMSSFGLHLEREREYVIDVSSGE